jgi:hypothetical protein
MENQELVNVQGICTILKVKPSWIYFRTMQTGNNAIPRVKVGKYLRFDPGKVMKWIEAQYNGRQ